MDSLFETINKIINSPLWTLALYVLAFCLAALWLALVFWTFKDARKRIDDPIIVVVADVADLWALERAHATNGFYHVLGATLSPLDGVGPQDLTIDALVQRALDPRVTEIILALNATVDGQTTAHYITDMLQDANVKITRLAHGVPVGGELDYLDEGTLSAAMRQRTLF